MNDIAHQVGNLFFIAFGIVLIALALFAPRGRGEWGARAKRVALFIAGSLMMASAILRLTSK